MNPRNPALLATALALALAGGARAQSLLHEALGNDPNDRIGHSVAGRVDLDLDGFDDVVVGVPFNDSSGLLENGSVRAISGRTGSLLWKRSGDSSNDHYGWSVAVAGDVDADGVEDVLVGARNALSGGTRPGMVRVLSGSDGATIWTIYGNADGDEFGYAVAGRLDWDADAHADFAVGAPGGDLNPSDPIDRPGYARVFAGVDGTLLDTMYWLYEDGRLGEALSEAADVDGDLVPDYAVGAPGVGPSGEGGYIVVQGGTGDAYLFGYGNEAGSRFGAAVALGLDANGDGRSEILVGAPDEDAGVPDSGTVQMLSALNGTVLQSWLGEAGGDHFGTGLCVCGDVDGDGVREVAVGATEEWAGGTGSVRVFGSTTWYEVLRLEGEPGSRFGRSVSRAGDFNNDGLPDLVVGAPFADDPNDPSALAVGLARVHSAAPPGFVAYCTAGTSASGCQALLSGTGLPSATSPSGFTLTVDGVEGSVKGMLYFGWNGRQAQPWGNGTSFQCVVPPVKRGGLLDVGGTQGACDGIALQDLNAHWCPSCTKPNHNPGAGAVVQAQFWYRDKLNTSNQTTSLSHALEFALAP